MNEDDPSDNCTLYSVDDLARFLVENSSSRKQQRLRQHLQTCSCCRQRIHELSSVRTMLNRGPDVALPRSFTLSAQDVRRGRHILWYPVLRSATTAVATLVLLLLLGGLLQPALLGGTTPAPLAAPTPRPVAVAPASTSRARPTQAVAGPAPSAAPTAVISGIASEPPYPQPSVESGPRIHATVSQPAGPASTSPAVPPQTTTLWPAVHLGGLFLLGMLAGLTWLAYRHERAFFS
jgi:hypothetical protein